MGWMKQKIQEKIYTVVYEWFVEGEQMRSEEKDVGWCEREEELCSNWENLHEPSAGHCIYLG
jgi:hypothetical protein